MQMMRKQFHVGKEKQTCPKTCDSETPYKEYGSSLRSQQNRLLKSTPFCRHDILVRLCLLLHIIIQAMQLFFFRGDKYI